jgi:Ras-related protein Rab-21
MANAAKPRPGPNDEVDAKVVLLGDSGVGKTSLAVRYVQETFSSKLVPTIGASFLTKRATMDNFKVKLQLWDTAGQERFRSLAPMYYRGASAAVLVYDITSEASFTKVQDWVTELRNNIPEDIILCIVGNKADLEPQRKVPLPNASDYAASIGAVYFESSAKSNTCVDAIFSEIVRRLKEKEARAPGKGSTGKTTNLQAATLNGGASNGGDTGAGGGDSGPCSC